MPVTFSEILKNESKMLFQMAYTAILCCNVIYLFFRTFYKICRATITFKTPNMRNVMPVTFCDGHYIVKLQNFPFLLLEINLT